MLYLVVFEVKKAYSKEIILLMLIPVVWYSAFYLTSFSCEPLYQGKLVLDCYLAANWYCHTPAVPKSPNVIAMAFQWWYHCAGNVYENIMSNVSFQWMTWQSYVRLKWLWTIINHVHMCLCALLCAFKCVCLCVCLLSRSEVIMISSSVTIFVLL